MQINEKYAGGFCQFEKNCQNFLYFAIFDVINSKFMVMINNWEAEPEVDGLLVFEIIQPQNNVELVDLEASEFRSKIDQNLIYLSDDDNIYEDAWIYKFTMNKNVANLVRSQFEMFISFNLNEDEESLKTIWDGEHNFSPL